MDELPTRAVYDVIIACPNLKHIELHVTDRFDSGLFSCVQTQIELQRFLFDLDLISGSRRRNAQSAAEEENSFSSLLGLINHFQNEPSFVKLELRYIPELRVLHAFKNLLGTDNIIIDTTVQDGPFGFVPSRDPLVLIFSHFLRGTLPMLRKFFKQNPITQSEPATFSSAGLSFCSLIFLSPPN